MRSAQAPCRARRPRAGRAHPAGRGATLNPGGRTTVHEDADALLCGSRVTPPQPPPVCFTSVSLSPEQSPPKHQVPDSVSPNASLQQPRLSLPRPQQVASVTTTKEAWSHPGLPAPPNAGGRGLPWTFGKCVIPPTRGSRALEATLTEHVGPRKYNGASWGRELFRKHLVPSGVLGWGRGQETLRNTVSCERSRDPGDQGTAGHPGSTQRPCASPRGREASAPRPFSSFFCLF